MTNGIPTLIYHFFVLCLKANIPANTPMLPKAVAMKNNIPSEIRSAPFFLDLFLSKSMTKKANKFIAENIVNKIKKAFSMSKLYFN